MKKSEFSYMSGRALSHASLEKFRVRQTGERKTDSFSKDQLPSHNVKYYSNEVSVPTTRVNDQKKMENHLRIEEDLRKKIKTLEYELKKKINEHSSLVKLFKTKNCSELPHLDIYLEMRKFEEEIEMKNEEIKKLNEELNEKNNEIDENLENCRNEIETASQKIGRINDMKTKLEEKIEEKERILNDERKSKEEKDNLLKEIRRRYEELQRTNEKLENELLKTFEAKDSMERTYKEKLCQTKEDNRIKIEDNLNEIERFNLKIREQQDTINELYDKIENMERIHNQDKQAVESLKQQLDNKTNSLNQTQKKFHDISERLSVEESAISSLSFELESLRAEKNETKKKNEEQIQIRTSQIQEAQKELKNEQQKYEKLSKEVSILEEKLRESRETIKVITFERDEKENCMNKMESKLAESERIIEEKEKLIEEVECKLFNAERRASTSMERLKELEKDTNSTKEFQIMHSKLEIENYKSIGRLTEMVHQIKAINSKIVQPSQSKSKSIKLKTIKNSEEFETITECISNLTKELNALVEIYLTTSEENKENLDNVRGLISDIKAIVNVYDSYVRDDELKGATREYMECLEGEEFNKKNRAGYLQPILERLISMTAIEFYASEKGISREIDRPVIPNRSKYSTKRFEDSLENSESQDKWQNYRSQQTQHSEEQFPKGKRQPEIIEQPEMRVIHRVESSKRILGESESRYQREKESLRKKNCRVLTEECDPMPMRRLEYGKENIMARLNREPIEDHNKNFEYSEVDKKGYPLNLKSDNQVLANLKRSAPNSNLNQTHSIEQKYFR